MANPITIFISYGRDENHPEDVALVHKVREDLENAGYRVLMDVKQLRTADEWDVRLEEMIEASDWVLFFITPYSARRPKGFCLNELAYALATKKKIAPVMVKPIVVPISICRLQYLDLQQENVYDDKLEEIISVINGEKKLGFEGEHIGLLNSINPMSSDHVIAKHAFGFVGRKWLYETVDKWLKDNKDSRILWITAEAGYGKTALSVYLSGRHPQSTSIHFITHDKRESQDPIEMLKVLIYELSTQIPEYHKKLLGLDVKNILKGSATKALDELIRVPLLDIEEPEKDLFFIIDALDEATQTDGRNPIAELIANHFSDLPQWLNIIITSRNEPELRRRLSKFNPLHLRADQQENHQDLKEFIHSKVSGLDDEKADLLVTKSEGNILYLQNILSSNPIGDKGFSLEDIKNLPIGMEGFYLQYFERKFSDVAGYEKELLDLTSILVASKEGMSASLLQYILNSKDRSFMKKLNAFGSLIERSANTLSFYHKSLYDWLLDIELSGDYSADIQRGHELIAKRLWLAYEQRDQHLPLTGYEPYLLESLYETQEYEKLNKALKDILFIGKLYNQTKQDIYKTILSKVILENNKKIDIETLKIYESFFIEKEHLITRIDENKWKPNQSLFQLAYEDGDNSPLSRQAEKCIEVDRVDFLWLKQRNRSKKFRRTGLLKVLQGHTEWISGVSVLKDGNILSATWGKELRIWTPKGDMVAVLEGHTSIIKGVKILEDGNILSYSDDSTLRIWTPKGDTLAIWKVHTSHIYGVKILEDGNILSYSDDSTLRIWTPKGDTVAVFEGHTSRIDGVKILEDRSILSYSNDKTLRLWTPKGDMVAVFEGHTSQIEGVKILEDRSILSYSWDNTLRLWTPKGDTLAILKGHTSQIWGVEVLEDGNILSYSDDSTLRLWTPKGDTVAVFEGHTSSIHGVKILEDGNILSYSDDKTLRLWTPKGDTLAILKGHTSIIKGVKILEDGNILSYSDDKTLRLWTPKGDTLAILKGHLSFIHGVKILEDGNIFSYSVDSLRVWTPKGDMVAVLEGHTSQIEGVEVLEDENILSYSMDYTLRIWSIKRNTGTVLEGHTSQIEGVKILEDRSILSYSWDNTLRIWTPKGDTLAILKGHTSQIWGVEVLEDGNILSYSDDSTLRLWTPKGDTVAVFEGHTSSIHGVKILEDGNILSYSDDKTLRLWTPKGDTLAIWKGHLFFIHGVKILEDGNILSYSDDSLRIWTPKGDMVAVLEGHTSQIEGVEVLEDRNILSYSWDNTLRIWTPKGDMVAVLEGHTSIIKGVKILEDGNILSYSNDSTLRLWTPKGDMVAVLEGHTSHIYGVKILEDGNILSYSNDKTLRLWTPKGDTLAVFEGHTSSIHGVKILEDGNILSNSEDNTLRVWSTEGEMLNIWHVTHESVSSPQVNKTSLVASSDKSLLLYDFYDGNKNISI